MKVPIKPGFYWSKWKIASEGTANGEELTPNYEWGVVKVFVNNLDTTSQDYLMVSVPGVEQSQSVVDFYWGQGPLKRPS